MLAPSLKMSIAEENSRTVTPDLANAVRSGVIRICGAPESSPGKVQFGDLPDAENERKVLY